MSPFLKFAFGLAGLCATASAQYVLNHTLGSCADVHCPTDPSASITAQCQITNHTYEMIGLDTFTFSISPSADLAWTIATHVFDNTNPSDSHERVVNKAFYLGTPPDVELPKAEAYSGCAVFLYRNNLLRPDDGNGTCNDVIGSDCASGLVNDAKTYVGALTNASMPMNEVCQKLEEGLRQNFTAGCKTVAGKDAWNAILAIPLTGPSAPTPPSDSENSTSTCNPVIPASNDLTLVASYNETGTDYIDSTVRMLFSVNLALSVFWSPNGSVEGALQEADAQLSCLWPIDLNDETLATMDPGSGDDGKGGAGSLSASVGMAVLGAVGSLVFGGVW